MGKRFVIGVEGLAAHEVRALKDALAPAGWWTWIPNFWLVKDSKGQLTATAIRDEVKRLKPGTRCIVLDIEPNTWATLGGKDAKGRKMSDWLKSTWDE